MTATPSRTANAVSTGVPVGPMCADGDAGESRRQRGIHGPVAAVCHWHPRDRDIWSFARDTSRNVIRHLTCGERTLELVRGYDEMHDGMLLSRWPLR